MFNIEAITKELSDGIANFQKSIANTNEYVKKINAIQVLLIENSKTIEDINTKTIENSEIFNGLTDKIKEVTDSYEKSITQFKETINEMTQSTSGTVNTFVEISANTKKVNEKSHAIYQVIDDFCNKTEDNLDQLKKIVDNINNYVETYEKSLSVLEKNRATIEENIHKWDLTIQKNMEDFTVDLTAIKGNIEKIMNENIMDLSKKYQNSLEFLDQSVGEIRIFKKYFIGLLVSNIVFILIFIISIILK